jgi:putative phosphoesterase
MAAPLKRKTARIPVRHDGSLRIAVVGDTHSAPHPDAGRHLEGLRPDAILHAGDIGDLEVLEPLAAIAPLHAVRGNIDTRADALPDVLTIDFTGPGDATLLRIFLTHIAVVGPRLRGDVARMARSQEAQMVVCGHSHVPFMGRDGGLTVFNPGSIGPRRFHLPIVFGTIDVTPKGISLAHYDCETGARWMPP